jgi:hypothetical protein
MIEKNNISKQIPFTEIGMRNFKNVNDAVQYFISQQPKRSVKSIVCLFQQSIEVKSGNVSILIHGHKSNEKSFETNVEMVSKTDSQRKSLEKSFEIWIDKSNGIQRIPENDLKRIMQETKSIG